MSDVVIQADHLAKRYRIGVQELPYPDAEVPVTLHWQPSPSTDRLVTTRVRDRAI